ncbi:ARM repeat-containing protein [Pholiota conissans]|uniref:ARM repeat-containing protein n=1 Tax=Pholiota conissans TaxID=109636 RepID=A0A9P5ZDG8_9AGAR|nr:ARM repeat-containing protein [Pholiota conissans]
MESSASKLAAALADGAALLGTPSPSNLATNLKTVLRNRLSSYYTRLPNAITCLQDSEISVEDLQFQTGREALSVVQRVNSILDCDLIQENSLQQAPAIGNRDLGQLRTLLSLTFKWAVEPLFRRISDIWPSTILKGREFSKIVDFTVNGKDFKVLSALLISLFSLVFPDGVEGRISQTLITTTIISFHTQDVLLPSISLGWLPESQANELVTPLHEARALVIRFLRLSTPAQAISILANILSSQSPSPPLHTRKACTFLLTKQIQRPSGVKGLCEAMFTSDETLIDDEKLEQVAKTVNSVPSSMKAQEYYREIFPQVLKLLTSETQPKYKRAAAFVVFRAIVPKNAQQSDVAIFVLDMLHLPFLELDEEILQRDLSPGDALWSLVVLMSNTEPSPQFISQILSPIIPALYALLYDFDHRKVTDPQLKEFVVGLLISWGKIVDQAEGSNILRSIIEDGRDYEWKFSLEGNFVKSKLKETSSNPPALVMPGDLEDSDDLDLNIFNFFPDPVHFVKLLKQLDRGDVASSIFINLLEDYRYMKGRSNENSIKILHKLQIIMQMQKRLSEGTTSNILRKPDQLLTFIFHVLDAASLTLHGEGNANVTVASPSIPKQDDLLEEADSDDEDPDSEVIGPDDELIETAITLLLSILEADETLTARTHPIFNDIFAKLEPLALKGSSALRRLAREARLVITARLANTSGTKGTSPCKREHEDDQEVYQKALKLLQDPILPVRAHGLLLLRELVGPRTKNHKINQALVPSILSIFLQAVQDEDSYMYLNAVQGLTALSNTFGKEIIQALVQDYADRLGGLGAGNLTQQDLDVRTRIGEALSSVIKRCGTALSLYVDILVPPMFSVVRNANVPLALRTSCLSLLADCVDTYPLAMLPYTQDLSRAMIDLLQTEHSSLQEHSRRMEATTLDDTGDTKSKANKDGRPTLDLNSTPRNSKITALRRAAIHFLSLLIRAATKLAYEETMINPAGIFVQSSFRRMSATLDYISSTDDDNLVRIMARETKENLEELQKAALGLP